MVRYVPKLTEIPELLRYSLVEDLTSIVQPDTFSDSFAIYGVICKPTKKRKLRGR